MDLINQRLLITPLFLISSLLIGCGSDHGAKQTESQNETPVATEELSQLTLTALQKNNQGKTHTDTTARFLVHDDKGNLIGDYSPNDDGKVNIDWGDTSAHLSYIRFNEIYDVSTEEKKQVAEIDSFINLSVTQLYSTTMFRPSTQERELAETQIDLSQLQGEAPTSTVIIGSGISIGLNTFDSITVNYEKDESKINVKLISSNQQSARGGLIELANKAAYRLNLNDFSADGVLVSTGDLSAWPVAYIYTPYGYQKLKHYHNAYDNLWDNIFIYPAIHKQSQLITWSEKKQTLHADSPIEMTTISRRNFDTQGQLSTTPTMLTLNSAQLQSIEATADQLTTEANSTAFDLSLFQNTIDLTQVTLCGTECADDTFSWTIHSTAQTQLPNLSLPEDMQTEFDNINKLAVNINLVKYTDNELENNATLYHINEMNKSNERQVPELDSLQFEFYIKK
ncbi:hypothetical protein [uncultured Shewanella sp.]|uniref:hypothetical protein n=1 Tax=uncultured Shewanella sp. TaxID=173975 RepID=UPI00260B7365|nr:hypothetical protein [uncultured Shewanella sp.]